MPKHGRLQEGDKRASTRSVCGSHVFKLRTFELRASSFEAGHAAERRELSLAHLRFEHGGDYVLSSDSCETADADYHPCQKSLSTSSRDSATTLLPCSLLSRLSLFSQSALCCSCLRCSTR